MERKRKAKGQIAAGVIVNIIWPAETVQTRSGCTVSAGVTRGPQALLCDSTVYSLSEARDRSAGVFGLPPWLFVSFCTPL